MYNNTSEHVCIYLLWTDQAQKTETFKGSGSKKKLSPFNTWKAYIEKGEKKEGKATHKKKWKQKKQKERLWRNILEIMVATNASGVDENGQQTAFRRWGSGRRTTCERLLSVLWISDPRLFGVFFSLSYWIEILKNYFIMKSFTNFVDFKFLYYNNL